MFVCMCERDRGRERVIQTPYQPIRTLCAMANLQKECSIYVGIDHDGTVQGVQIDPVKVGPGPSCLPNGMIDNMSLSSARRHGPDGGQVDKKAALSSPSS